MHWEPWASFPPLPFLSDGCLGQVIQQFQRLLTLPSQTQFSSWYRFSSAGRTVSSTSCSEHLLAEKLSAFIYLRMFITLILKDILTERRILGQWFLLLLVLFFLPRSSCHGCDRFPTPRASSSPSLVSDFVLCLVFGSLGRKYPGGFLCLYPS